MEQVQMGGRSSGEAQMRERSAALLQLRLEEIYRQTGRHFAILTAVEWVALIAAGIWLSPRTWAGLSSSIHPHIWMALGLGGAIASLPILLNFWLPVHALTRHIVAASQMLLAGLAVHITGGRIETHFMYFGLLAFLAFYHDWRILLTATAVAGLDHLLRAILWPQSLYGVSYVTIWRPLEHAAWVIFEVVFLADFIRHSRKALRSAVSRQARLEVVSGQISMEFKHRTAELADSEERYRAMFDNSPLPMWLYDADTLKFLRVNRQAVLKYGYSEDEFMAMHASDLRPAEDVEAYQKFMGSLPAGDLPLVEFHHITKEGKILEVEVIAHRADWCGTAAYLVVSNDVTDRKQADRERQSMEIQLRHAQKLESIGQLAAGIAHEINTPTQYIGDNLHFLRDAFRDLGTVVEVQERLLPQLEQCEPVREHAAELRAALDAADTEYLLAEMPRALDQALDGVVRVSTLVKAMKEFSHPGQKEKSPANLNRAIESTVTVARNEWKYVAEMQLDLQPDLPLVPCLISDFNQVILNLIVNAAHAIGAANPSGSLGTISIRTRALAGEIEVRVADSGGGIPESVRSRIFDPFFTTKEVGQGSGQGLAIARSVVVDKHRGTIHFETEIGKGTAFIIRLPLETDNQTETVLVEDGHLGENAGDLAAASVL